MNHSLGWQYLLTCTGCCDSIVDPGEESSDPGVDSRVARLGTAPAPANNSYLRVGTILSHNSKGAPAVPLTRVFLLRKQNINKLYNRGIGDTF